MVQEINTDIQEGSKNGDNGSLAVIAIHPKVNNAVSKYYQSDKYQSLKAIRDQYTNWNFQLQKGKY